MGAGFDFARSPGIVETPNVTPRGRGFCTPPLETKVSPWQRRAWYALFNGQHVFLLRDSR